MIYQISHDYFLRPLKAEDLNGPYSTWFEDQEVCKYNAHGKFFKDRAYFEDYLGNLGQEDRVVLAICHSTDGHIGNISLQEISMINRSAEFAILLGDKRHWGKRVGALAAKALIEHGFRKLNLERVYCGTAETNIGMRKLAQELGMVEEGRRRKHLFLDGSMVDMVEYGLLRTEFKQSTD
jgi:[ribosomal protein S5]-alanine N-acetyltransferase